MEIFLNFLKAFKKYKWWIIVPFCLSIVIAVIFTMPSHKPPLYKATLQFFPTRLPSSFRVAENHYVYQFLTSKEIENAVLDQFGSKNNVDTKFSSSNYKSRVQVLEDQNIVTINVRNEKAETALDIAQYLVHLYDERSKELKHNYYKEHADFYLGMMEREQLIIDSVKKELYFLAKDSGLFVQTMQTLELAKGTFGTAPGTSCDRKAIEKTRQSLSNNGGDLVALEEYLDRAISQLIYYQHEYERSLTELTKMNHYSSVFSSSCTKKPSSNRLMVIVLIPIVTLCLSLLLLICFDTYCPLWKKVKEELSK